MKITKSKKDEIEKTIKFQLLRSLPTMEVYLSRMPNQSLNISVLHFKGKVYIYDLFANKYYSMKDYGKKWAFAKEELK